jgi:hypothetical protein
MRHLAGNLCHSCAFEPGFSVLELLSLGLLAEGSDNG